MDQISTVSNLITENDKHKVLYFGYSQDICITIRFTELIQLIFGSPRWIVHNNESVTRFTTLCGI
jgi:hypothetical protein